MLTDFNKMGYSTEANRTDYRFPFKVLTERDLRVFLVDPADGEQVPLFLAADYKVIGAGDGNGGHVELTTLGLKKAKEGLKILLKLGQAYECAGGGGTPFLGNFDLSYEEQWTGFYDRTDGDRKIYVKTVDYGQLSNACSGTNPYLKKVPHGIVGVRKFYRMYGMCTEVNGADGSTILPHVWPIVASAAPSICLQANSEFILISNGTDRRHMKAVVTLLYTKNE